MHFTLGREQLMGRNHSDYAKQKGMHVYEGASILILFYASFCISGFVLMEVLC
jgi:hypothetical protein